VSTNSSRTRNQAVVIAGLGIALLIAVFLSPFASKNPDGLDRVSKDHNFEEKALKETPAQQLPFHKIFDEYSVKGLPETIATPVAGLIGTLVAFSLAWGIGKLVVRNSDHSTEDDTPV
jgi:cobalt/nickel transport protein